MLTATSGKPHEMASNDKPSAPRRLRPGNLTPTPVSRRVPDATDHDKNLVAACINHLVRKGRADLKMLRNGELELRLKNGRIFHLDDEGLRRVA